MKTPNDIKKAHCSRSGAESTPRIRVRAQQSNHGGYDLPPSLAHLPAMPLYLAVAYLGMLKRAPLSRLEVAQAFGLDTRRALEVMRYLASGKTCVACERVPLHPGEFGKGYRLRIDAIGEPQKSFVGMRKETAEDGHRSQSEVVPASRGRRGQARRRPRLSDELAHQSLRRWFLRRPNTDEQ
ncbi:CaiF/GrlA family transcriptional regulator [Serratia marcescens]|uniref:CaiF/GrlA family transcriptional regulator n=1 Tax=Serratia marcescens TaxID=615 RepID=UPI002881CF63|nr:CaiF/GrlA family transcriptional regulator [Serratia marcescens]MDT0204624.1 CaiF/GrlA family transcriptional regulator [Serratia marcescens]